MWMRACCVHAYEHRRGARDFDEKLLVKSEDSPDLKILPDV